MATKSKDRAATILNESPLFAGTDPGLLDGVLASLDDEVWPKRRVILTPGQQDDRIYVLLEGRVKVSLHNYSGRELTLFLLGPGDVFNMECLLDGQDQELFVQALERVEALSGPSRLWTQWLDSRLEFRSAFRRYLDKRLRGLIELAGDLALHDTMTRLIHLLLRYSHDGDGVKSRSLIEDLPNDELAHMIGTVRVVVSRLLAELRNDAIIDTKPGRLRVLNLEKLKHMAELRSERHSQTER